ncbi:MAG: hypothetical protein MUC32_07660 [Burkholderiaceae bacterium]|nr:hypothetical protein [Burkholderiaceae bacterium]
MTTVEILHETRLRLRAALPSRVDAATARARLEQLPGVQSVRVSEALHCIVVAHDGRAATRDGVIERLATLAAAPRGARAPKRRRRRESAAATWTPAAMAIALPLLPGGWRAGGALATIAARALAQREHWRADPAAVLLDAAALAAAAVSGHPLVVTASVVARALSEQWSVRLVDQADALLDHLLPVEAATYPVLVPSAGRQRVWVPTPPAELHPGDRLRLDAGAVVPVDGRVAAGRATLVPQIHHASAQPRAVGPGDPVAAGEQLHDGTLELLAEADASSSRLERLRAHVRHAAGARDPAGRLAAETERLVALPLTGAALVLGLTGDGSRAAAMLQADPQQGIDLALPVAREAALYTLARQGLLAGGLEAVDRLAAARTLVLQDSGVLATGRWHVAALRTARGVSAADVRRWLARAAGQGDGGELAPAGVPDALVRRWWRYGALVRAADGRELHLAGPRPLRETWGEPAGVPGALPLDATAGVQRELARALRELGFERLMLLPEGEDAVLPDAGLDVDLDAVTGTTAARAERLADAARDGRPLVLVHTVFRDLVPAGSVGLTPADADAGAHGVLLGDPLASLVAARRVAMAIHRRLRRQQAAATVVNAALMTSAALRWLPPVATSLLHHGFVLAMLVDSIRLEALDAPDDNVPPSSSTDRATAEPEPSVPIPIPIPIAQE